MLEVRYIIEYLDLKLANNTDYQINQDNMTYYTNSFQITLQSIKIIEDDIFYENKDQFKEQIINIPFNIYVTNNELIHVNNLLPHIRLFNFIGDKISIYKNQICVQYYTNILKY